MKKLVIIIISCIFLISAVIGGYYIYNKGKFIYNNEDALGNTAGNLNNSGYFCEYNGYIYFANPNDNFYLYKMKSDCTEPVLLKNDSVANINVCGNYIYYAKNNFNTSDKVLGMSLRKQLIGLYRIDLNGKDSTVLYNELSGITSLCGNHLFYQRYTSDKPLALYSISIDGKENKKISDTAYNPSCILNGIMYYADQNNKNAITSYNTNNGSTSLFYNTNAYLLCGQGNYLYYIDISKSYSLVRINISTKTVELIYSAPNNGKIINFNLYGSKIFFQTEGDKTGLYRINTDGTQLEFIAGGNLRNLSCTSQYTFFQYYEQPEILYRVPTTGVFTKVEEIQVK